MTSILPLTSGQVWNSKLKHTFDLTVDGMSEMATNGLVSVMVGVGGPLGKSMGEWMDHDRSMGGWADGWAIE